MIGQLAIPTREIAWSWQGRRVTLGIDEAGAGPAVLLLPALSSISTRREMQPLLRGLASTFRVIAPDWPGFGDRSRPAIAWTPGALSAFLDHLTRQELPPLHATIAAGHAASFALHLATQSPGTLGRLALLAPTWRGPLPTMLGGERPVFRMIRRAVGLPVLGPLLYRANVNRFVVRMMIAGHVYSDANALSGDRLQEKRDVMGAAGARFGSAAFVTGGLDRVGSRAEWLDLARSICGPLLVVYGTETPHKSRAEMEALAALPGVQSVVMPRGKLAFYEEFAADVIPTLAAFLSSSAA